MFLEFFTRLNNWLNYNFIVFLEYKSSCFSFNSKKFKQKHYFFINFYKLNLSETNCFYNTKCNYLILLLFFTTKNNFKKEQNIFRFNLDFKN